MRLDISNNEVSLFRAGIKNTTPYKDISIKELAMKIRESERLKELTENIRSMQDHAERQQYKGEKLPFVTFSGTFANRNIKGLKKHSSFLCFDIDGLKDTDEVNEVKDTLINNPYFSTVMMFTSPSGNGVKWIVYVDLKRAEHKVWYDAIRNFLKKDYDIDTDKTQDVSRVCYLSYDEDFYYTNTVYTDRLILFPMEKYAVKHTEKKALKEITTEDCKKIKALADTLAMQRVDITTDYDAWIKIGLALAGDFGEEGRAVFHTISSVNPNYSHEDCDRKYDSCLKGNNGGATSASIYFYAKEQGIIL